MVVVVVIIPWNVVTLGFFVISELLFDVRYDFVYQKHFDIWLWTMVAMMMMMMIFQIVSYQRTFLLYKHSVCRKTFHLSFWHIYILFANSEWEFTLRSNSATTHHFAFTNFLHQTQKKNTWKSVHSCTQLTFNIPNWENWKWKFSIRVKNELPVRIFIHPMCKVCNCGCCCCFSLPNMKFQFYIIFFWFVSFGNMLFSASAFWDDTRREKLWRKNPGQTAEWMCLLFMICCTYFVCALFRDVTIYHQTKHKTSTLHRGG